MADFDDSSDTHVAARTAARYSGYFDRYETGRASGWVANLASPQTIVSLTVLIDGAEIDQVLCDGLRPDVRAALELGSAQVGFTYDIPETYLDGRPHVLSFLLPDGSTLAHMGADGLRSLSQSLVFSDVPHVALHGQLDGLVHDALRGWVLRRRGHAGALTARCDLLVTCDEVRVGQVRADRLRRDAASVMGCDPNCGFEFTIPAAFRKDYPQKFRVFVLPEMLELSGSPLVTRTVSEYLEGRLLALASDMSRMHADLERMRREIDRLLPSEGYHLDDYDRWARRYYEKLRARVAAGRQALCERGALPDEPLVSVLVPTYKPALADFVAAIDSVIAQTYRNWELIIIDDGSRSEQVSERIDQFCRQDGRIRCIRRSRNVGIARATSLGMDAARGAWTVFFDHDDMLVDVALEVMIRAAQRTGAKLLYSDEDKLDQAGYFREPNLKPDWSYRYVLGCNYVCHLTVVETETMRAVGPLRREYDGAQDHDFILRCAERLDHRLIHHVPELLYHWRMTPNSTASDVSNKQYAVDAGVRCVADHLERTGRPARVTSIDGLTIYAVEWPSREAPPVSVIIPFRDEVDTTRRCVESLLQHTRYDKYDIVLVDNWSTATETLAFLETIGRHERVRVLRVVEEFNYSRLNNLAARDNQAAFYVFLNNDMFVSDPDWLRRLVGEAQARDDVGIVGAKLLYPDHTVQHAGVVVGPGGIAEHVHLGIPGHEYGYIGRARLSQEYLAVTAACLLIRADLFHAVGGFDETDLRVAYNDVDLCLKVHERGARVIWCADVVAEHHESLSRGSDRRPDQEARLFREQQVMLERWGDKPFFREDPFYNPNFAEHGRLFHHLLDPAERPPI